MAIIGLGYVGLPLAIEFAKHFHTVGFDISEKRTRDLKNAVDLTKESTSEEISAVLKNSDSKTEKGLFITGNQEEMSHCNIFIVPVPTPI